MLLLRKFIVLNAFMRRIYCFYEQIILSLFLWCACNLSTYLITSEKKLTTKKFIKIISDNKNHLGDLRSGRSSINRKKWWPRWPDDRIHFYSFNLPSNRFQFAIIAAPTWLRGPCVASVVTWTDSRKAPNLWWPGVIEHLHSPSVFITYCDSTPSDKLVSETVNQNCQVESFIPTSSIFVRLSKITSTFH